MDEDETRGARDTQVGVHTAARLRPLRSVSWGSSEGVGWLRSGSSVSVMADPTSAAPGRSDGSKANVVFHTPHQAGNQVHQNGRF